MTRVAHLPKRGVIAVAGPDRVSFLNGLVSNDVAKAVPGGAVWAALLTAQGRYVTDFFILADEEQLLLDLPRAAVAEVATKLRRYRLRAAVSVEDQSDAYRVYAAWGGMPPPVPVTAPDPRLCDAGFRCLSRTEITANATDLDYAAHRLILGLPDGPPDLEPGKTLLLEAGFNELGGVAWDKGCYMGQELTARTKYRGLVKRRLVPVRLGADAPEPGTPVFAGDAEMGTLRSGVGRMALAMLRTEALGQVLRAGDALVAPVIPNWMDIQT
ncbi:MAG: folate-binding protein [Acidocella sp.]|nr:folate-binding protein [Acidocella sp.]